MSLANGKGTIAQPSEAWALLDRLYTVDGELLTQTMVSEVAYTVEDITDPDDIVEIVADTLDPMEVIFDTLQLVGWDDTIDDIGYNLRIDWPLDHLPPSYSKKYRYTVVLTIDTAETTQTIVTYRQTLDVPPGREFYGTVVGADVYFSRKYGHEVWKNAKDDDKIAVLIEATQHIDLLNYYGSKTVSSQVLEFPRGGDTSVPTNIIYATYEEAYQILSGRDIVNEVRDLGVYQRKFGPVSTTYLQNINAPLHVAAGIISSIAWQLLCPYLRRADSVTLVRVS